MAPAVGKVSAMRFLSALTRPWLILLQRSIKSLRLKFGIKGVDDAAVSLKSFDLFFDKQGKARGFQPDAKKWILHQDEQTNNPAERWFDVALDGRLRKTKVLPDLPRIPGKRTMWLGGRKPAALEDMDVVVDDSCEKTHQENVGQ